MNRSGNDQATVEVTDSSVLDIERQDVRTYVAEARSQGVVTLTLRESGDVGTTRITVAQPDSVELADGAVFVRGGLARAQLRFSVEGQVLRARDVITFAENAQVILPERGQDELWVRGGDLDEMPLSVTVNTETFSFPVTVVDADAVAVAQLVVQGLNQQRYEAQVLRADGVRVLGAEIVWSLDGVELPPVADSPGDHYASLPGAGDDHELCARVGTLRSCRVIYQGDEPGLID